MDQHHDVHGIEHRPDDWKSGHHTILPHDTYRYIPEHSFDGDFELHNEHSRDYTHDSNFHGGHGLMGQIEHEFDDLFHNMEHKTLHGIEHHDVHYPEMSLSDHDADD